MYIIFAFDSLSKSLIFQIIKFDTIEVYMSHGHITI